MTIRLSLSKARGKRRGIKPERIVFWFFFPQCKAKQSHIYRSKSDNDTVVYSRKCVFVPLFVCLIFSYFACSNRPAISHDFTISVMALKNISCWAY